MNDFLNKCFNVVIISICLLVFVMLVDIGLKNKQEIEESKKPKNRAMTFKYENHEYIYFDVGGGAILHNPDCEYCKGFDK